MNENSPVAIVIALVLIAVLACGFFASSAIETVGNANTARIAEARAQELQARAIEAQARVDFETAAGERAILEAAADAVEQGNQALVADRRESHGEPLWPYLLGACFVIWLVIDWRNSHRTTPAAPSETPTPLTDWIAE